MNKKEMIYKEYGIEYDSKKEKIYYPGLERWISLPLVDGNGKIGKTVYHFSTLPGTKEYHINITLKQEKQISQKTGKEVSVTKVDNDNPLWIDISGTCICDCEKCYAMTGNYLYDTTLAHLAVRTLLARFDIEFLEKAISAQIKANSVKLLRIHASGDFYGIEYIEMWQRIVENNPDCVFWSYTKNPIAESAFNNYSNCNIVKSRLPDMSLNYGTCREIMDKYAMLKAAEKRFIFVAAELIITNIA